jgi:hypothetical protein
VLVDFSPNPVNVICNNFLQQMEIDALQQLISEDVKVQGQISCVMISELASWSLESSPELLPESSLEEMRSTSTTLLPGSSLEESVLTSMRVDRFFLRVEKKTHASPWRASLESANLALVRVYGFLPQADEEPTSSMERRGRHTGVACWDGSSFPAVAHMSHYADSFGGARARSRVQGCRSSHNHSIAWIQSVS